MDNNLQWINCFKNQIETHNFLHYDKINKIKIFSIYCIDSNIEYINTHKIDICNCKLDSNTLLKYIVDNKKYNNINFKFKSLYKYSLNLSYNDILNSCLSDNYFNKLDIFKDIYFDDCIKYFKNVNNILIIYNNNSKSKSNINSDTRKLKSYFNKTKKL
jgi:hypothetical protein